MADLILDIDYNITQAEAKQRKLDRELQLSQQKADNIKKEIEQTKKNIEESTKRQKDFNAELDRSANKLESYRKGGVEFTKQQFQQELKNNAQIQQRISKEEKYQLSQERSLAKQKLQLDTQNAKTASIGDKIISNTKKQNKFTQAFEKSSKSADRFGKRLKSLIASALFFSVVTKAFTALREQFGKLINETGTKTASLVAQLNSNLAVLGRTLYEGVRPYIEWVLEKLVHITQLLTTAIAKALGKDVKQMKALAESSKGVAKNAENATASFDTLQKLNSNSATSSNSQESSMDINVNNDSLEKTKKILEQIMPLAATLGIIFAGWKITQLLDSLGLVPASIVKIIGGALLIAAGFALLSTAAINWDDSLHDGGNTLNAIIGTIGTILIMVGLISLGIAAWPVLIIGAFIILGMWLDNYKDKVDKWINSLPFGIYELVDIIRIAAYGVWDFIKNLFKGLFEIFTGEPEKGFKRIGIALVNLLIDALNIVIQGINFLLLPIRELILKIGKAFGKKWDIKDVAIQKVNRIPQLATGAVLPGGSPMLAWVNDQPKGQPYVEGSIENIAAAFEKYLGNKGFGNQNITLEAKGNWAQFIKWMNLQIKQENNRSTIWG